MDTYGQSRPKLCRTVARASRSSRRQGDVLDSERLRARLPRCRTGPAAQNRDDLPDFRRPPLRPHRRAEQINPARGLKLRRAFERIDWGA
jgi:hypothetical protein